jgi:hypothetical protein
MLGQGYGGHQTQSAYDAGAFKTAYTRRPRQPGERRRVTRKPCIGGCRPAPAKRVSGTNPLALLFRVREENARYRTYRSPTNRGQKSAC